MSQETAKDFRVALVGGGIGGLCCAVGLLNAGLKVDIFEAASRFEEIGAGVGFGPNANAALKHLGLWDDFVAKADVKRLWFHIMLGDPSHDFVVDYPTAAGGNTTIHRADFLEVIVKHIPPSAAHFGKRCVSVHALDDDMHRITFADGTTHDAEVVIGADGIRSATRDYVLGRRVEPRFTGTCAYRGLFPAAEWEAVVGPDNATQPRIYLGVGKHLIIFPVRKGQIVNLVAFSSNELERRFQPGHDSLPEGQPWVEPTDFEAVAADFTGWGPHVTGAFRLITKMTKWSIHSLWPPLPTYTRGRVALMGDAAHGLTPHCGQGAGQALEDAMLLCRLLAYPGTRAANIPGLFAVYDELRRPRGNRVLEYSLETGDVWEGWGPSGATVEGWKKDIDGRMAWIWDYDLDEEWKLAQKMLEERGIAESGAKRGGLAVNGHGNV